MTCHFYLVCTKFVSKEKSQASFKETIHYNLIFFIVDFFYSWLFFKKKRKEKKRKNVSFLDKLNYALHSIINPNLTHHRSFLKWVKVSFEQSISFWWNLSKVYKSTMMRDTQADVPSARWLRVQLVFKDAMIR
jgi:hypothetical protein